MPSFSVIAFVTVIFAVLFGDYICVSNQKSNGVSLAQLGITTSTTPWPELGKRPPPKQQITANTQPVNAKQNANTRPVNSQDLFIRNEQNYGQPFVPNNQNMGKPNQMRPDAFVQSQQKPTQNSQTKPNNLMRQDTFVLSQRGEVNPNNQQQNAQIKPNSMMLPTSNQNANKPPLNRQDTFVISPKNPTPPTNGQRPLVRQDTFVVKPGPQTPGSPNLMGGPNNAWNNGNPLTKPQMGGGSAPNMNVMGGSNAPNMNVMGGSNGPNMNVMGGSNNPKMNVMGGNNGPKMNVMGGSNAPKTNVMGGGTPSKAGGPQNNAWGNGSPFGTSNKPNTNPLPTNKPGAKPGPLTGSAISNMGGGVSNNNYVPPAGNISEDDELREFAENLLKKDVNNAAKYVTINFQKMTTSWSGTDEAPQPLLTIDKNAFSIPSIQKMMLLYNNYILETNENEHYTAQEKLEENDLLDVILQTPVMQYTRNFLIKKGKLGKDPAEFKSLLREIWFNMYSRGGGRIGSSGFEHVFLAELKKAEVSGLHNWVYFNAEESQNRANYLGYLKKIDLGGKGAILKHHFTFHGVDKPVGSMFIGTSPELEVALYSTCFILRADKICPLKMNNNRFIIRTFTYRYRGKNMIGSAFPEI